MTTPIPEAEKTARNPRCLLLNRLLFARRIDSAESKRLTFGTIVSDATSTFRRAPRSQTSPTFRLRSARIPPRKSSGSVNYHARFFLSSGVVLVHFEAAILTPDATFPSTVPSSLIK